MGWPSIVPRIVAYHLLYIHSTCQVFGFAWLPYHRKSGRSLLGSAIQKCSLPRLLLFFHACRVPGLQNYTHTDTHRHTDTQTHRHTHTHPHPDAHAHASSCMSAQDSCIHVCMHTDGWMDKRMNTWTDGWMWMDGWHGWLAGRLAGWLAGWLGGWMD